MNLKTIFILCINLIVYIQAEEFKIPELNHLKDNVNRLIIASQNTSIIWDRLAEMTDLYGHRITGSKALEDSIDWIKKQMKKDGLDVYTQDVTADYWHRNEESLVFHSPTRGDVKLDMLGLGRSIATPKKGITGEVVVVTSLNEAKRLGEQGDLKNKIVLFNFPWTGYGAASNIRQNGATLAAQYGGLAALIRAAAPFSLNTPHTGVMKAAKVPGAVVTVEDAEMLTRIYKRAQKTNVDKNIYKKPTVTLKMAATIGVNKAKTRNLIGEIKGCQFPDEVIVLSGHIDSWDVGVGAMDDAAGAFIGWEVLRQLKQHNIKAKRTIRVIFWVNEEAGVAGGKAYYEANKHNLNNHVLVMESDSGTFDPYGFHFSGNTEATAIFTAIGKQLLGHTKYGNVGPTKGGDTDIDLLCQRGVPCASLSSKSENNSTLNYFTFHHTAADRMEVLKPELLAKNAAMTAGFMYAVADLDVSLPRSITPEIHQI